MPVDQSPMKILKQYTASLEAQLHYGITTEHSHRPALKTLLESLQLGITSINEPKHIAVGAPDFIIKLKELTVGFVEAKDIGISLDEAEKSEQFKRYLKLPSIILTDYLEFRWFVNGSKKQAARLGWLAQGGEVKVEKGGLEQVAQLVTDFLNYVTVSPGTPKELAERMAYLAHLMRDIIIKTFETEAAAGSLHDQMAAFKETLIPGLTTEQFADMYAQTVAYGLFAARATGPDTKDFTRKNAAYLLPKTNPFLFKLFSHIAGPDLDDRIAWLVDDLAQLLGQTDMAAILADFGKKTGKQDPVVHFYETFLKVYDPQVREMRGVYYTPLPVVSYIVRSVNYILKTHFNKTEGLTDPSVLILDPAVGTATFLYEAIQLIHESMAKQHGAWDSYVAEKLLPRLFGFELLMAPYAVAHLKLGLQLKETGYTFHSDERLGVYLTNTLEEAVKHSETLFAQWISQEANAAADIKKTKPIMVVLGNPPYSGESANKGESAKKLVEPYKIVDGHPLGEKNPKWLNDDYVKFIAFGQQRIEKTGYGVLAYITNHSYLENPTFRGMRQSLMNTFNDIYILNLHGNSKKKETAPDGSKDENVFDIQQGVAISMFVKNPNNTVNVQLHYADLWGLREAKYQVLFESEINTTNWQTLVPDSPNYMFKPANNDNRAEYENGWEVTNIFLVNGAGMTTARDSVVIDYEVEPLVERATLFRDSQDSNATLCEKLKIPQKLGWNINKARELIAQENDLAQQIKPILYRPFDMRLIFYHDSLVWRTVKQVMRHMLKQNIALLWTRPMSPNYEFSVFTSSLLIDQCAIGNKSAGAGISYLGPLYLYPSEQEVTSGLYKADERRPNISLKFIADFEQKLRLKFVSDGKGDLKNTFGPEDIFNYAYAIFHSPTYRTRYAEFLKIDFPRLPLTSDKGLFKALAEKGAELAALHLMESTALKTLITTYPVAGSNEVGIVNYDEKQKRVYISKTQYFDGVPSEVWNFRVGGYQVCQKWLKDRKGRILSYDDIIHYQKIIVALKETKRLMGEIDSHIQEWPIT